MATSNTLQLVSNKKRKKIDLDFCIICQTTKPNEILSSTELGRNKIITSSRILQDNLLEGMSENNFSVIKYHSNSCYKPYCLKSRRSEEVKYNKPRK